MVVHWYGHIFAWFLHEKDMTATATATSASRGGVGEGNFGVARQHPTDVLLPNGLEQLLLQLTRFLRHREVVNGHLRDWNEAKTQIKEGRTSTQVRYKI